MQRQPVVRHGTAQQAWAKYRACRHPVEKTRWHLTWLLLRTDEARTPAQAAAVVGISAIAARAVLKQWNASGPAGLADRRANNWGPPALADGQWGELFAALKRRPPDGGLWTGPKVAAYARNRWGVEVRPPTGWRWLRDLVLPSRSPPPTPGRPTRAPARGEKGNLRRRAAGRWAANPGKRVEGWAEAEARLGLQPIARRVWSLKGRRPRCGGRARYDWLYVYGFGPPKTGQSFCVLLPRGNAERMGDGLAAFAAHADPRGRKVLVVPEDNAG